MNEFVVTQGVRRSLYALSAGEDRDYIGEPVSQLTHALQCADLAQAAGARPSEVLAALFHDVGHLIAPDDAPQMNGLGVLDHERLGAEWLRALGFDAEVCELVGSHVEAKRYLAFRRVGYLDNLSLASRGTLAFQGGPMSESEAALFEGDPLFAAKVRLRVWDETAKDPRRQATPLDTYADLVRAHLEQDR